MIFPKVAMISGAIATMGILFNLLHLNGDRLLLVGCSALAITIMGSIYFIIKDQPTYKFLFGYLLRMIPIFLVGLYMFGNKPVF
ncbi:MAG: hypothetical protein WDO15_10890 [Bacteroidota bacterium]